MFTSFGETGYAKAAMSMAAYSVSDRCELVALRHACLPRTKQRSELSRVTGWSSGLGAESSADTGCARRRGGAERR